jgi:hypothetical protein
MNSLKNHPMLINKNYRECIFWAPLLKKEGKKLESINTEKCLKKRATSGGRRADR